MVCQPGTGEDEEPWDFEPLGVDEDVLGSRQDFPEADEEDFEDDTGDWSVDDYVDSAQNLFGDKSNSVVTGVGMP